MAVVSAPRSPLFFAAWTWSSMPWTPLRRSRCLVVLSFAAYVVLLLYTLAAFAVSYLYVLLLWLRRWMTAAVPVWRCGKGADWCCCAALGHALHDHSCTADRWLQLSRPCPPPQQAALVDMWPLSRRLAAPFSLQLGRGVLCPGHLCDALAALWCSPLRPTWCSCSTRWRPSRCPTSTCCSCGCGAG